MSDERGLVGRAAVTLLVLIVLGGLAAVDGTSVLFATLKASDVADAAAAAGEETYASTHNVDQAKDAAVAAAHEQDRSVRITGFQVTQDGTVTVSVRKKASTLIVQRVSFLRHFGIAHASSSSGP